MKLFKKYPQCTNQNKMKKRIIQTSITLNLSILFLIISACQAEKSNKMEPVSTSTKDSIDLQVVDNKLSPEAKKLVGTWNFGHEPVAYDFNIDGSFREYAPKGALSPEADEEIYNKGKWALSDGQLLLYQSDKTEKIEIHWLKTDAIFLGDLEQEYSPEHGTKEEFASEMGWVKAP